MAIVFTVILLCSVQTKNVSELKERKQSSRNLLINFILVPSPIQNLQVVRTAMSGVRLVWDPLDLSCCNTFKGYQVYLSKLSRKIVSS